MLSNKQRLKDQYAGYILPPNVPECTISQTEFFTNAKVLWARTKRPEPQQHTEIGLIFQLTPQKRVLDD